MQKWTYAVALMCVVALGGCSRQPVSADPIHAPPPPLFDMISGGGGLGSGSFVSADSVTIAEARSDSGESGAERGGGGLGSGS